MQDEHWCLQQFLATVLFFIKVAVGGGRGGGGKGLGATWYLGTWIISLCITSHLAGQMSAGLGWAMDRSPYFQSVTVTVNLFYKNNFVNENDDVKSD